MIKKRLLIFMAQVIVGGTFLCAGTSKMMNGESFKIAVSSYHILPENLVGPFSKLVPIIELLFGVLLILDVSSKMAVAVLSTMLAVFIAAIMSVIVRDIPFQCGCFDNVRLIPKFLQSSAWIAILRNVALLVLCFILMRGRIVATSPGS
jgi:uncharacterized membrane protein